MTIELDTIAKVVAILAALGGMGWATWARGVRPAIRWARSTRRAWDDMVQKVDRIDSELRPNGGGSIRDAIDRVELRQVVASRVQDALLVDQGVGCMQFDTAGACKDVNRGMCYLTGRPVPDLIGHGWLDAIDESERKHVTDTVRSAMAQNREFIVRFHVRTPAGALQRVRMAAFVVRTRSGTADGYVALVRTATHELELARSGLSGNATPPPHGFHEDNGA